MQILRPTGLKNLDMTIIFFIIRLTSLNNLFNQKKNKQKINVDQINKTTDQGPIIFSKYSFHLIFKVIKQQQQHFDKKKSNVQHHVSLLCFS